ncbi:hypothetical protein AVEN_224271-1 [Araneus ventricosus]|uniref:Uncharacterized protein n=1 Tax=Araneus ventricosus TaxID=182803 RepID=A0A4Y2S6S2_ARAVE|nr:hypothetical protein AVEN_224271-1 [Araneus ventricosus]
MQVAAGPTHTQCEVRASVVKTQMMIAILPEQSWAFQLIFFICSCMRLVDYQLLDPDVPVVHSDSSLNESSLSSKYTYVYGKSF